MFLHKILRILKKYQNPTHAHALNSGACHSSCSTQHVLALVPVLVTVSVHTCGHGLAHDMLAYYTYLQNTLT